MFTADIPTELDRRRRRVASRFDRAQRHLAGLDPLADAEQLEALRDRLRRLRDEARDVEEEIRRTSPRLAALHYPRPLDLAAAREALDPGTLMLSYSVGEERSHLFAAAAGRPLTVHSLAVGAAGLKARVELYRQQIHGRGWSRVAASRQRLGTELYRTLIGPVADRVRGSERLLIIPDGPLHLLPFAALVREVPAAGSGAPSWQYLVEWKPLHTVLSATVYAELRRRRRLPPRAPGAAPAVQLAAFGDPHYPATVASPQKVGTEAPRIDGIADAAVRSVVERGLLDFAALPSSRREVERIGSFFPAERRLVYLGRDATEDRVKALGKDARIVHLAAHGFLDERLPLSSFLALTIPEGFPDDRDNGLLQAWEIFESVRLDADLVVLSACESAVGREQGGEGLISLSRAFQYAGARTVAATLWKVADRATAELMIRFYRHLRAGRSKDEALRAAQIDLIRGPIQVADGNGGEVELDASAPYYWAAVQLFGDWR